MVEQDMVEQDMVEQDMVEQRIGDQLPSHELMAGDHSSPFQSGGVSFVRRDNRLRPRLQRAWDDHHATWVIDVPRVQGSMSVAPGFALDQLRDFGRHAPLIVELGSGTGDAVVEGAQARPGTNFLAVDVYRPGLAATMTKIVRHDLTNIRLVQADAVQVLEHMVAQESVDEIWVFFADPWHKMRHHKRRLVTPSFAELAASRLTLGGTLRLSTDWADYARQMRDVLTECVCLTNPHGAGPGPQRRGDGGASAEAQTGFAQRFEGRGMTSFEQKGLDSGRAIYDLEVRRV